MCHSSFSTWGPIDLYGLVFGHFDMVNCPQWCTPWIVSSNEWALNCWSYSDDTAIIMTSLCQNITARVYCRSMCSDDFCLTSLTLMKPLWSLTRWHQTETQLFDDHHVHRISHSSWKNSSYYKGNVGCKAFIRPVWRNQNLPGLYSQSVGLRHNGPTN
jgi:hypothetical protein